ncbi:MAG: LamG-like jellyroll fold domain-containing protein [Acidimicrobiia bacterium]
MDRRRRASRPEYGFSLIGTVAVAAGTAVIAAIVVPSFLSSRAQAQDDVAKTSLRSTLSAAPGVMSRAGLSPAAVTATAFGAGDETTAFTADASTGPRVVSVASSATSWSAAALSKSGSCFSVKSDASGTVTYGHVAGGTCSGATAALVAVNRSWDGSPSAQTLYPTVVASMSQGLLGYWKFDEKSGAVAADSSGAGTKAALVNTPTTGVAGLIAHDTGKAIEFDGTDYAELPSLGTLTQFTMNAWVSTPWGSWWYSTIIAGSTFRWNLRPGVGDCAGSVMLALETVGSEDNWTTGVTCLKTSTRYLLTATADGSMTNLYVNGVAAASRQTTNSLNFTNARVGLDGVSKIGAADGFQGTIDEVSIWNRALSAAEITNLYTAGS